MKSTLIYIVLFLAICVSVYFMYQRSFVTHDFEIINSEEDVSGEMIDGEDTGIGSEDSEPVESVDEE